METTIITDRIALMNESVTTLLQPLDSLNEEDQRKILKRYCAAMEGNFISWMAGASISSRSVQGKHASDENLWEELTQDHPSMLRKLAKESGCEPEPQDHTYIENEVQEIRRMVAEMSGLKSLALMTFLENTSVVFIPYLSQLAEDLGCSDTTYTDLHGEADLEHAEQFQEALGYECQQKYLRPQEDIEAVAKITLKLLEKIFRP